MSYDAYGNAIGFIPNTALTTLLYCGERFDIKLGMLYLRARYYDLNTGRFNRLDPFFGVLSDPQSLHKYTYCHGDPVNNIDYNGAWVMAACIGAGIGALVGGITGYYYGGVKGAIAGAAAGALLGFGLGGLIGVIYFGVAVANAISVAILSTIFSGTALSLYLASAINWGVKTLARNSGIQKKKVAVIYGPLGVAMNASFASSALYLETFVNCINNAGHEATLIGNCDETKFIEACNTHDAVLVVAHGLGRGLQTGNYYSDPAHQNPIIAFKLSGTSVHPDEPTRYFSGAGDKDMEAEWITAKEVSGKVHNPNLKFFAASCRSAKFDVMQNALNQAPGANVRYFGFKNDSNSGDILLMMHQFVNYLNDMPYDDWVDPTAKQGI